MPGKKKKFIEKKNSVTFSLVHRSQRDPQAVNEDAPQRVLLDSRKEEQINYGIQFDDDYNYLQHLKEVKELYDVEAETFRVGRSSADVLMDPSSDKPKLLLPSAVFGSEMETIVGMLNKAAPVRGPQPDLDPDILAALDGDLDEADELDDDFILHANADDDGEPCDVSVSKHDNGENVASDGAEMSSEDEDFDSDAEGGVLSEDDDEEVEETRSRFTGCSMSSSVIRRNAHLQMIDAKFAEFYKRNEDELLEDDDEMLDNPNENSEEFKDLINKFNQTRKVVTMKDFVEKGVDRGVRSSYDTGNSEEEEMEKMVVEVPAKDWDCETILSTYSTTRNQPMTVHGPPKTKPIKLTRRLEIPSDVLPPAGPTRRQLEAETREVVVIPRNKDETLEEKKARKKAVKESRKARRIEKSATKELFKEERCRLKKQMINMQENFQGSFILQ